MLSTDRGKRDAFRSWLEGVKGFAPGSASDVISRCKRAERLLGQDLDSPEAPKDARALRERLVSSGIDVAKAERTARDIFRGVSLYLQFARREHEAG